MSNFIAPKVQSEVKTGREFEPVPLFEYPFYIILVILGAVEVIFLERNFR